MDPKSGSVEKVECGALRRTVKKEQLTIDTRDQFTNLHWNVRGKDKILSHKTKSLYGLQ